MQQEEEPTEKIEKMKQLLLNKLKAELFFGDNDKEKRKKKETTHNA